MVSAQFIALWLVLLGAASAQWPGNRLKPGLMFAYTFEEGQLGGNPTTTADKTGQNLLGPLQLQTTTNGIFSTSSIGLSVNGNQLSDGAISLQDITALLAKLPAGRDFSVEMWLKVNAISGANAVGSLFSITTANINAAAPDGLCTNTLLNIDQGNNQIFGRVSTSGGCFTTSGNINTESALPIHFVFSRQDDNIYVHVNKVQKAQLGGLTGFDYSGWPTAATLKLAHKYSNTWKGTILAVAMYNQSIHASVATNFDAWLPNSRPICPDWSAPWTIATDEDILGPITLNATDLDFDTKRMWGANPPAAFASIVPVTYQITALPTRGSLYKDAAGTLPIRSNDLPYVVTAPNRVWFRALPDEFSVGNTPYTTFQFQAFDGTTFSTSCNVPVHVAAVPDAPIADNAFTTADAQRHTRINLTASCADGPFTIANYSIVNPLPAGDLFFVNNDGSVGSQILAPATLPVHSRFNQVYYRPLAGSTSGQLLQQRVMINFRATSVAGRVSNQANVTVQVLNELQALTKTDEGDEDTDIDIFLEQSDFPNNLATTSFEIRSLPAKGKLYTTGGADIVVGSIIPASASAPHNARIVYKPPADAFGDNYASFTYQAIRSGGWRSGLGTLVIRVIAVNDAPVIHYPAEITVGFLEEAFIHINITDVDDRGQLYTLKLHSSLATFTLNQQARSLIPGAQVNPGVSEGFFIGDGDSDQDCTFWTYLPKMNMTMAPFTILGSSNPAEGTLTLTVEDLDVATKGGSKEAQVDIRVKIIGSGRGGPGGGGAFPEWVQYLVWSGASAVGLGCCGCLFYKQVYVRIKKRSATSTAATYAVSL